MIRASDISFNEGIIRLAAIHQKTVEFRYVKDEKHPPETRRFIPKVEGGDGAKLRFTGLDPDRDNNFRSYRLDRIKGTVDILS